MARPGSRRPQTSDHDPQRVAPDSGEARYASGSRVGVTRRCFSLLHAEPEAILCANPPNLRDMRDGQPGGEQYQHRTREPEPFHDTPPSDGLSHPCVLDRLSSSSGIGLATPAASGPVVPSGIGLGRRPAPAAFSWPKRRRWSGLGRPVWAAVTGRGRPALPRVRTTGRPSPRPPSSSSLPPPAISRHHPRCGTAS